ncbi:MAG TPA: LysR family transcriptional regulator, partial [Polyangiaceae bacterium]|nr:LysR family transcriptional regulator [Polyangiaceae bacterium]
SCDPMTMSLRLRRVLRNARSSRLICYNLIQMTSLAETSELLAFVKTVESKSLSRAALDLGVPRATIGRRLARLEERVGSRLLRRTTRSLTLTAAGADFYRHAGIALDAVRQAEASVRRADGAVRGSLRVSLPPQPRRWLRAAICDFARRHPEVSLHLHVSARYVDLARDGYDVAVRANVRLEPGQIARTLWRIPLLAVASPAYLAERGEPRSPRALRQHRCLLGFARGEVPDTHWPLAGGGRVRVEGSFAAGDLAVLREAALQGLGIALLPHAAVAVPLKRGTLVHVLPGAIGAEARLSIVYAEREFVPPQVRAFADALTAWRPDAGKASAILSARDAGGAPSGSARGADGAPLVSVRGAGEPRPRRASRR